jgi:hypothetical protein
MQKIAVEHFYLLEEVSYLDSLRLLLQIANVEALLFDCIAGEHIEEMQS